MQMRGAFEAEGRLRGLHAAGQSVRYSARLLGVRHGTVAREIERLALRGVTPYLRGIGRSTDGVRRHRGDFR